MSEIGSAVTTFFGNVLEFLHDLVAMVPFLESAAWGWAIILLTLIIRILLLPLAIKQTRSMRAMQALQPQIKELQSKYKVDRDLMRKDPERYRARKQKLNEEMMALYQREGANPLASCLPLLAQAPVFLALFWTLRGYDELFGAEFYFFTSVGEGGLDMLVSQAGWPGWLLIVLMSGTMFWSQRQMMARTAAQSGGASNPMAQQQKILLYVMPVFLAVISFQFPLGILLYWVTTNAWQVAQQAIILREVKHEAETGTLADHPGGAAPAKPSKGSKDSKDTKGNEKGREAPKKPGPGPTKGTGRGGKSATSGAGGPTPTEEPESSGDETAESSGDETAEDPPRPSAKDDGPDSGRGRSGKPKSKGPHKRDHLPRRHDGPQR